MTDRTEPDGRWQFDESVTDVFDDMLERSIPQYELMRQSVFDVACRFLPREDPVRLLDLGTSRGGALAPFVDRYGARLSAVGIDVSEPMLTAARERFRLWPDNVRIENLDVRYNWTHRPVHVVLSVLFLQFVPIEYRQKIVANIYSDLEPGGALILVEKVLGSTAQLDSLEVDLYLESKKAAGYTQEQIDRKRLSLEGVLVPVTAKWNEELLAGAGFRTVDCFWRWMNFAGWIAVKEQ